MEQTEPPEREPVETRDDRATITPRRPPVTPGGPTAAEPNAQSIGPTAGPTQPHRTHSAGRTECPSGRQANL